ncbi:MAG: ABC transporter permease subunit [Fusobacteriaceae bacterium]|nr:ABC transporter permease subunit [Fusobacteriaceae bacterium]MBN2838169.1 ABC transporter permease subunit [Fusobacteriaceae bacterium]
MKKSFAIGKYIVKENLSNKILNGFIIFAIVILFGTLLLKELTIFNGEKIVKDIGMFLMEFFIFLVTVFSASSYLIRDHKEKSIYLVLTKPVSRTSYIIGNVLGNIFLIIIYIFLMTIILGVALFFVKEGYTKEDFIAIFYIFEKLAMLVSLGVFFAVISDSYVTANIFTFSSYILGHFTSDILELVKVTSNEAIKIIMKLLTILLPRYSVLNYRDFIYHIEVSHLKISIYVIVYIVIVTLISSLIFEKRKL